MKQNFGDEPDPGPNDGIEITGVGGGGGGGCGPGTFEIDIDSNGIAFPAGTAKECVDQEEASRRNKLWIELNPGDEPEKNTTQQNTGGGFTGGGPTRLNFGAAPSFTGPKWNEISAFDAPDFQWDQTAPEFQWGEQFNAPSYDAATSDPGYQFRLKEGERALANSKAAQGVSRTGGTLKDFLAFGQNAASQEYGNVYDRYAQGYNTRLGTAKTQYGAKMDKYQSDYSTARGTYDAGYREKSDEWNNLYKQNKEKYDAEYASALAAFAPKFQEWLTNANATLTLTKQERDRAWQEWLFNHIPATMIFSTGANA